MYVEFGKQCSCGEDTKECLCCVFIVLARIVRKRLTPFIYWKLIIFLKVNYEESKF